MNDVKFNDEARWYVTLYQNHWGRGHTPEESKREARKRGGKGVQWVTLEMPEHAQGVMVDGLGRTCWEWPCWWTDAQREAVQDQQPLVVRRGKRGRGAK